MGTDADWASAVAGDSRTFGVKTDGTLWAWGSNGSGELGDGSNETHDMPGPIP